MKKNIYAVAISLLLSSMMLFGCSNDKKDKVTSGYCDTVNTIGSNISYGDEMVVMGEADQQTGKTAIKFYYPENDSVEYMCGRSKCEHIFDEKSVCDAIFDSTVQYPFVYKNKVYYFALDDTWSFCKCNTDGTSKEKITELQFAPDNYSAILLDEKLYLTSYSNEWGEEAEDGNVMVLSETSELYELDINTGEQKQLTNFGKKGAIGRGVMVNADDKIYLQMLYQNLNIYQSKFKTFTNYQKWLETEENSYKESIAIFDQYNDYYCVNLKNGSIEKMSFNYQMNYEGMEAIKNFYDFRIITINEQKCYYVTPYGVGYTLYQYDFKTQTSTLLDSSYRMTYAFNDGKIYIANLQYDESKQMGSSDAIDTSIPPEYKCYDIENEKWIEIELNADLTDQRLSIEAAGDNYLYGYLCDFKEGEISEEAMLTAIEIIEK